MIDADPSILQQVATQGVLTRARPSATQQADIAFAMPILRRLRELNVGHCVALKEREIIAVEASEGMEGLIRRAGDLCRRGRWMLLIVNTQAKMDAGGMPQVDVALIGHLKAAGATCLGVEAGGVALVPRTDVIAAANRAKVAIVGIRVHGDDTEGGTPAPSPPGRGLG